MELQDAEAKSALLGKTATMHVLTAGGKPAGPTLGPTVLVNILLEGHPVKALVDTRSSINCLLDIPSRCTELERTSGEKVKDIQLVNK